MTTDAPTDELHGILVAVPAAQRWRFLGELPRTFTLRALELGDARGLWECEACQYPQVFVSAASQTTVNQIPCRHCDLAAQVQRIRESVIHLQGFAVETIDKLTENRPVEGEQAGRSGKSGLSNAAPAPLAVRLELPETFPCAACHGPLLVGATCCKHCGANDDDE